MPRLKVFCTTSGFHDSVVAAPSRPAALKAWGARTDLFSMGVAKQVTDPRIVKRALARPGEVIRLGRSATIRDHEPARKKTAKRKPARPPSRARLTAAERRLEELDAKQAKEREEIDRQLARLEQQRDKVEARHTKSRRAAEDKVADAKEAYQAALDDWPG